MLKKIGLFFLIITYTLIFVNNSLAEQQWYTCRVEQVGPAWGTILIRLTDINKNFENEWIQPYPGVVSGQDMLGVGLIAVAHGNLVYVNVDIENKLKKTKKNKKKFKNVVDGCPGLKAIYLLD